MKLKAVLFDFDGVIIDSDPATIETFQATMENFNLPIPKARHFQPLFGLKAVDIAKNLLPDKSDEEISTIYGYYKQIAPDHHHKIRLFPKAVQVLDELNEAFKLALITSRGKVGVEALLKRFDLNKYFQITLDREDVSKHKPDPEGILIAMKELGINANETVYIGDTKVDVQAAHNASMPCILISQKKESHGAKHHIGAINKVPTILTELKQLT